jgi:hypothetical protein
MAKAGYRFVRLQGNVVGRASSPKPTTDAIKALSTWSQAALERLHTEVADDAARLIAYLACDERDTEAGLTIEDACQRIGDIWSRVG